MSQMMDLNVFLYFVIIWSSQKIDLKLEELKHLVSDKWWACTKAQYKYIGIILDFELCKASTGYTNKYMESEKKH